ncbi:hypothetical protein ACFLQV_02660 [Calditrichota bacterium]
MIHLTEDQLLKLSLETISESEANEFQTHLNNCEECTSIYEQIKYENALIETLNYAGLKPVNIPLRPTKKSFSSAIMKLAAILIIGFVSGYFTAKFVGLEPLVVSPGQIKSSSQISSYTGFYNCEPVDLEIINQ